MRYTAWFTRGTAGLAMLAGGLGLAGRLLDHASLARLLPGAPPLHPLTALAFLLCGAGLWLSAAAVPRRRPARLLAGSVVLGAGVVIPFQAFTWRPMVESWFLPGILARGPHHDGATDLAAAAVFACLGASLFLIQGRGPRAHAWMHLPLLPVFWLTYVSLLAGFYGVLSRNAYFARTLLPLPTAILFMLLVGGILTARPGQGLMTAVTSRFSGGVLARIVLPLMLLLPFTIGWVRVRALRTGVFDLGAAFAQFATTNILIFGGLIWFCAHVLNRIDAKRQKILESLRDANQELHRTNAALESKITEQKSTEEARKKTELQLFQAQKMQAVGTLASGIAHDFNNILTVILLNAETAEETLPEADPVRQHLREIRKSGTRASHLVRQLMTFGRKDSGDRRPVELDTVVAEAMELLRHTLPSGVQIRTILHSDSPRILADATQIHQILLNLGTNAAHSMAEGGGVLEIRMHSVGAAHAASSSPEVSGENGHVRLTVSDTGHGMDGETLKRIFDPFFTTKPPGKGTGLGLSVVHGIVKLHGGDITVSSTPGQGTVFTLDFPALAGASPLEAPAPRRGIPPGKGTRLLCVDDNELILSSIRRKLQPIDYVVTCSPDPRAALEDFRARPGDFDLVLTDFSMPGMSGPEFARKLLGIRPDIPVVMMSGFLRPEDVAAAQKNGVRGLVRKPNVLDDLGEILHRLRIGDLGK